MPPADVTRNVQFKRGASSVTLTGTVKGYRTHDYILFARAGQKMSISLQGTRGKGSPYFVVFQKGASDNLTQIPSTDWSGPLPATARYTVRVLLMRAEARRKESSAYRLTLTIK